ncbi:hypothetical protein NZD89_23515 [Alicyclobacillus fastidiosus]|uniref:Asp-tRNA(Asn)/Glu-tRNA(Gln) amidotransferase GatCAB subunit C n=1 Tax=Alicyclobacillus fastidiosus TaxID=392011 RepID=A0ABY6ZEP5_9BACL|nr:hypothetical protein [Alicyclobacillus fastidiosus]WAH41200.1 hypothetical protein NZD89_23515 [Alicyclobacillus fastidiosus]GMA62778.1 hypothetical protein GCM10025859_32180 [Alicyclobacillus fastidiosus]
MQNIVQDLLTLRGIRVPEEDLEFLQVQFRALAEMRASVEELRLDDADIALVNVPCKGSRE